jgi:hypothetical protein
MDLEQWLDLTPLKNGFWLYWHKKLRLGLWNQFEEGEKNK